MLPAKRKGRLGELPSTGLRLCGCRCQTEKDDMGKFLASWKARWDMKKTADGLENSEGSMFNYLKKMEGEASEKDKTVSGSAPGA